MRARTFGVRNRTGARVDTCLRQNKTVSGKPQISTVGGGQKYLYTSPGYRVDSMSERQAGIKPKCIPWARARC